MLDAPIIGCGLQVEAPAPLPVEQLVLGKPAEEVAELVPRLFNLCRHAQEVAVRMALGLPVRVDQDAKLQLDIRREHMVQLGILLPEQLNLPPVPLTDAKVRLDGAETFDDLLSLIGPFAPVLRGIAERFSTGEGVAEGLELATPEQTPTVVALENSVAARQAGHPVLRDIETHWGRGPLWRAVARLIEIATETPLPAPGRTTSGWSVVPAARGYYAVRATVEAGRVTAFERITPTDHMLMSGGLLQRSLATLPEAKRTLAPLLLKILDPCVPLTLKGTDHA